RDFHVTGIQTCALPISDLGIGRTQESTPLYVDGVLYVTTAWSNVQAYDARTGERLWSFDAQVPREWGSRACCDVVNRGAAAWNGDRKSTRLNSSHVKIS